MTALFAVVMLGASAGVALSGGTPALAAGQRLAGASSVLGCRSPLGELGGSASASAESPESDGSGILAWRAGHLASLWRRRDSQQMLAGFCAGPKIAMHPNRQQSAVFNAAVARAVGLRGVNAKLRSVPVVDHVAGNPFGFHLVSSRSSIEREQILIAALQFVKHAQPEGSKKP